METHVSRGIYLAVPELLKSTGEVQFELMICFVGNRAALPNVTFLNEDVILED